MNQPPEIANGVYVDSAGTRHLLRAVRPRHGGGAALCGRGPGVFGWQRGAGNQKLKVIPLCGECRAVRGQ
jgi:hypothetical protein